MFYSRHNLGTATVGLNWRHYSLQSRVFLMRAPDAYESDMCFTSTSHLIEHTRSLLFCDFLLSLRCAMSPYSKLFILPGDVLYDYCCCPSLRLCRLRHTVIYRCPNIHVAYSSRGFHLLALLSAMFEVYISLRLVEQLAIAFCSLNKLRMKAF